MTMKRRVIDIYDQMDAKKYSPSGLYYLETALIKDFEEIQKELQDMIERGGFNSGEELRVAVDLQEELETKLKYAHIDSKSFDDLFETAWKLQKFCRGLGGE